MDGVKIVYLSGPISGRPYYEYQNEFREWEAICENKGLVVLNPAKNPKGLTAADYMRISLAQVEAADAIVLLPNWQNSRGAKIEKAYAEYIGKRVFFCKFIPWDGSKEAFYPVFEEVKDGD